MVRPSIYDWYFGVTKMNDLGEIVSFPIENDSGLLTVIRDCGFLSGSKDYKIAWVAGGAAMKLALGYAGLRDSDVDIFLSHKSKFIPLSLIEKQLGYGVVQNDTENSRTFLHNYIKFQIIHKRTYGDLYELFEDFDFTCCMFATDGYTIWAPELAIRDLHSRTLRVHAISENTISRAIKYMSLGFEPAPGLLPSLFRPKPDAYLFDPETGFMKRDGHDDY